MKRILSFVVVLVATTTASADTVSNVKMTGVVGNVAVDLHLTGRPQGENYEAGAGRYDILTGAVNPVASDYSWLANRANVHAYCIDAYQDVPTGATFDIEPNVANAPKTNVLGTEMGAVKARTLGQLWSRFFEDAEADNLLKSAFQLAVWEIVWEDWQVQSDLDLDEDNGDFYMVGAKGTQARNQANAWLADLDLANDTVANLLALTNTDPQNPNRNQDLLIEAVPSPQVFVQLLGLVGAVGGLGLIRRRRKS